MSNDQDSTEDEGPEPAPYFIRYRHRWSYTLGDWTYVEADPDENHNEQAEELMDQESGSHYRGVDIERGVTPPVEWFQEQVKDSERSILYHQDRIARYGAILNAMEQASDSDPDPQ